MTLHPPIVIAFSAFATAAILFVAPSPVPAEEVKVEKVAENLVFPEGPLWMPDGHLIFSDMNNGTIEKLLPQGGTTTWWNAEKRTNGLLLAPDGQTLYACCPSDKALLAIDIPTSQIQVLAKEFDGRPFLDVNDVTLDQDGNIFFTDPKWGARAPGEIEGIYCLTKDGKLLRAAELDRQPNGIGTSPDGQWLYVARTGADDIWRYRIHTGGKLSDGAAWAKLSPGAGPDGMTLDRKGNVYQAHAGDGQVSVVSPEGKILRQIKVLDRMATNCAFAGTNESVLYVTGGGRRKQDRTGAVYKVTLPAP